jgi:excisionase family DNA binding protein
MTDEQAEPLAIEAPKPPSGFRVGEPDSSGTTLTISEASRRTGVSVSTIRRRLKAGAIPGAYKTDGPDGEEWRIPVASLDGLASESSKRTTSDDPEEVEELRRQVSDLRTRAEVAEALLDSERRGRDELAKTVEVLRSRRSIRRYLQARLRTYKLTRSLRPRSVNRKSPPIDLECSELVPVKVRPLNRPVDVGSVKTRRKRPRRFRSKRRSRTG